MKKQNKKDNNSSFLVILLILAIIVIGVVLCFGWIVGAIWLLFFRKKSNIEPQKQELITASVLTLSIISFVFMVTSLIHSSSVEEGKSTDYVAEITTKLKKQSEDITTKKSTEKQSTTKQIPTESTTTPPTTTRIPVTTQATTAPQPKHKDLNGRGRSDSGREEPNYRNVLGYVAVGSNEESSLTRSEKFLETPWKVPAYSKVNEEYIESGFVEHKTEIVVKSQQLEHSRYGAYHGFLLVENVNNGEQFYIDVGNFITNPYWTFSDLEKAATELYVAEYNQVSDCPPVDSGNEKVDLDNGIRYGWWWKST